MGESSICAVIRDNEDPDKVQKYLAVSSDATPTCLAIIPSFNLAEVGLIGGRACYYGNGCKWEGGLPQVLRSVPHEVNNYDIDFPGFLSGYPLQNIEDAIANLLSKS